MDRLDRRPGPPGRRGRIAAYIVTYRRPDVLQRAVDSFWEGVHDRSRVALTILNNHSDLTTPTSSGPLRVVHNDVRPDHSWGYLARDWNLCLLDAFDDWRGSDVDWCVVAQNDVDWLPDWQENLDALPPTTAFFSQPRGDQAMGFRIDAVREVGFFDERFTTLGYQEQDYFTRAAISLGDRASINDDHFEDQPAWNPLPPVINTSQWHGYDAADPLLHTSHFSEELGNLLSHKWQVERVRDVFDRPEMVRRWSSERRPLPEEVNWYPFFWHGSTHGPHRGVAYTAPWSGPAAEPLPSSDPLVLPPRRDRSGAVEELVVRLPALDLLDRVEGPLVAVLLAFAEASGGGDGTVLVVEAPPGDRGADDIERQTAEALLRVLGGQLRLLDGAGPVVVRARRGAGADPPLLDLSGGKVRAETVARALHDLQLLRESASRLVALTPVQNRAAWAREFRPVRGFAHLAVDNASSDGTAALLAERGASTVVHEAPLSRTGSWARAVREAQRHGGDRWVKWLFAGDLLEPGAAAVLEAVIDAAPHVGLVVAEYVIDHGGGRTERWGSLPETQLVSPRDALRLSAGRGNWFGSPVGHAFSPAGLELLEVGTSPYVADWHACLSVASQLPTLYVKEVVGTFSGPARQHWQSAGESLHARVQEMEVRLRSATSLGPEGVDLLSALEREAPSLLGLRGPHPLPTAAEPRRAPARVLAAPATRRAETPSAPPGPVVAVQQPRLTTDDRDFHGYAPLFARQAQVAYLPQLATSPGAARDLGVVDGVLRGGGAELEVVTSARELQQRADVLVCFEGRPYLPDLAPPAAFTGLKAHHVMDFVFFASQAAESLRSGGADLLLGYARHDVHSPFFAEFYRGFEGRVHAVPFGYGERFSPRTPFSQRTARAIGLGAVNPVDDPLCPPGELDDYVRFHRDVRWTHAWRRRLAEAGPAVADVLDSRFPAWPETKDTSPDAAALLDSHQAYVNDVGLMAFPPVRTYEGAASGAVLVAPAHPVYEELGFQHGVNALFHREQDVADFRQTLRAAFADQQHLASVADAGRTLVRERYSHARVASDLLQVLVAMSGATSTQGEPARVRP